MSWHFSRALADQFSAANSAASRLSGLLSSTPSASLYYSHGRTTVASHRFRSGMMSERLAEQDGEDLLMWFRQASRAKTSPPEAPHAPASLGPGAASGAKPPASLAKFDRATRSWKTLPSSRRGALKSSWAIWPQWGMMLDGECFVQTKPEQIMAVRDGGLWHPTPTKCDAKGATTNAMMRAEKKRSAYLRYWLHRRFPSDRTTYPSPGFLELAMGFPLRWTRFGALGTHRFRQWFDSHGKPSGPAAAANAA